MPVERGAILGPYEITGAIGAGGMAEVYKAIDTRLVSDLRNRRWLWTLLLTGQSTTRVPLAKNSSS